MRVPAISAVIAAGFLSASCGLAFDGQGMLTVARMGSDAMLPTIEDGEVVHIRATPGQCEGHRPQPGDVVAHRVPRDGRGAEFSSDPRITHISRVLAGPGDRVAVVEGRFQINGEVLRVAETGALSVGGTRLVDEALPNGKTSRVVASSRFGEHNNTGPLTVPEGRWFMVGDNRDNSLDSRFFGAVPEALICGPVKKVLGKNGKWRSLAQ